VLCASERMRWSNSHAIEAEIEVGIAGTVATVLEPRVSRLRANSVHLAMMAVQDARGAGDTPQRRIVNVARVIKVAEEIAATTRRGTANVERVLLY